MDTGRKIWNEIDGVDCFCSLGSTYSENPNLYYLTRLLSMDDFLYLNLEGEEYIAVRDMEVERAEEESRVENVVSRNKLGLEGNFESKELMYRKIIEKIIQDEDLDVESMGILPDFPSGLYEELSGEIWMEVLGNPVEKLRAVKNKEEVNHIRKAQAASGKAVERVREILERSSVEGGRVLIDGEVLTSGFLKRKIEHVLVDEDHESVDCIVASGKKSQQPHYSGREEDKIVPGKPLIVDVFPGGKRSRYTGDMTRTFVKGEVGRKVREMYEAVLEAQENAIKAVEAGVDVSEVDGKSNDVFEKRGFSTLRKKNAGKAKFLHRTGHGLGLEVHEKPVVSEENSYELEEGNVITVEPGLYHPEIGGVRIEDVIVVQKNGCKVLESVNKGIQI